MLIVSQNKKMIINFDDVNYLQVSKIVDNEFSIEINYDDCNFIRIATYKTEKRAKEVKEEIITAYSDFEYYKNTSEKEREEVSKLMKAKYKHFNAYEMPEE